MTSIVQIKITSLGAQGDGVGEYDGIPVFVPDTMPGDLVSVELSPPKKSGIYGVLEQVVEPSVDRIVPECPVFAKCGGCQLQYLSKDYYARWLTERTVAALSHHGFSSDVVAAPIITPKKSRRRVALKALKMGKGVVLGFSKRQSHQIVDIKDCPVTSRELTDLIKPLRKILCDILPNRMQVELHLTLTATGIDMLIDAALELDLKARELLVDFANTYDIAAIHCRDQGFLDPVVIRRAPMMDLSGVRAPLSPAAFVQASDEGEKALVKEVVGACDGSKRVADLFCGIGTFTFPLARKHQVFAVEGARQALDALQAGANQAVGLKQIVAKHRDLYRRPLTAKELRGFDAVVFDPPRAGAKEQAEELASSGVTTIVAVSCNPNTFGRDARIIADGGYELIRVVPVDQFLWSPHIELVGVFTKS